MSIKPIMYFTQTLNLHLTMSYLDHILILVMNYLWLSQVFTDIKVAPIVELDKTYNGYAWDFYNHGIVAAIKKDNRLKQGEDFALLNDFLLMLRVIRVSLSELEPVDENDPVLKTFTIMENNFSTSFYKAYNSNRHWET